MQAQSVAKASSDESRTPVPSKLLPLVAYLDSLTGRVDLTELGRILQGLDISASDLVEVACFNPNHYARNKISCSDWYDLLVICWEPNQSSAIHDHTESSCGFKVVTGISTETVYQPSGNEDLVMPMSSRDYQQGEICLAQDSAIHKISNKSDKNNLITLHIYSPPLKMSNYEVDPRFE